MEDYMLDSQLLNGYDLIAPEGQFFSYIITYSGHGPYTDELRNISDPHLEAAQAAVAQSGVTGSEANMKEYTLAVAHAMETDQFVGGPGGPPGRGGPPGGHGAPVLRGPLRQVPDGQGSSSTSSRACPAKARSCTRPPVSFT